MSITKLTFLTTASLLFCVYEATSEIPQHEKSFIAKEIEDFLLENPEVIIESLRRYEKRMANSALQEERDAVLQNIEEIESEKNSYVAGSDDSRVKVIAFIDYRCGFCKKALNEISSLLITDDEVRLIIKEFPILGEESILISKASITLLMDEGPLAYAKFTQAIIKEVGLISVNRIKEIIDKNGGNIKDLELRMEKENVYSVINSNYALANSLKITGTPTFIIGTEIIRGYKSLTELQKIIERNKKPL